MVYKHVEICFTNHIASLVMKALRGSNINKETVTPLKKNQVETGQTGRVMSAGKNKGCILMNLRKNE